MQEQHFGLDLSLKFEKLEQAQTVLSSIKPELAARHNLRSKTIVKTKNSSILINIEAQDKTALKASLNSCLKSIILAKQMLEVK